MVLQDAVPYKQMLCEMEPIELTLSHLHDGRCPTKLNYCQIKIVNKLSALKSKNFLKSWKGVHKMRHVSVVATTIMRDGPTVIT